VLNTSGHPAAFAAVLLSVTAVLAGISAWQIIALLQLVTPAAAAPAICGTTLLHTMAEPPETQLTRDYAALKILLYQPGGQFARLRLLYEGSLRAPAPNERRSWPGTRSERAKLFNAAEPRVRSLQDEARRLDAAHGTALARRIDTAIEVRDRVALETTLREMFASLTEELLSNIAQRTGDPATALRLLPHVRRYYAVSVEAHLSILSPTHSRNATAALAAMAQALDDLRAGKTLAADRFDRERRAFIDIIKLENEGREWRRL
jgi:hypothetical protein